MENPEEYLDVLRFLLLFVAGHDQHLIDMGVLTREEVEGIHSIFGCLFRFLLGLLPPLFAWLLQDTPVSSIIQIILDAVLRFLIILLLNIHRITWDWKLVRGFASVMMWSIAACLFASDTLVGKWERLVLTYAVAWVGPAHLLHFPRICLRSRLPLAPQYLSLFLLTIIPGLRRSFLIGRIGKFDICVILLLLIVLLNLLTRWGATLGISDRLSVGLIEISQDGVIALVLWRHPYTLVLLLCWASISYFDWRNSMLELAASWS